MHIAPSIGKTSPDLSRKLFVDRLLTPVFLIPSLLVLLVIIVGPFAYMVGLSFTDLSYSTPGQDGNFVGFENYRRLVREDGVFWDSFVTTLVFVFFSVILEFFLGFAFALILYHSVQKRQIVLTLFLIPMMIAPVAVGLIWKLMLQGEFGMFSHYLRELGLLARTAAPLGDPRLVLGTIILIDVWEWTPFVTLIMLAGLLSLPREPFEAALMDGAKPYQVFMGVTLPLLKTVIALVILLRGIDAFREFDKVFILTGGGPGSLTELLSIYTYRVNFRNWDLGYGAVCAFMVYLVVLIMSSIFYKVVFWREGREA